MPVRTRNSKAKSQNELTTPDTKVSQFQSSENVDPRYKATIQKQCKQKPRLQLRHYHHNACRTKIHLLLDRKMSKASAGSNKKQRRFSYFILSQQYKRKMSTGVQQQFSESSQVSSTIGRKISWNEQSEFVAFNKNKSCQAIKTLQRHKFSIDE